MNILSLFILILLLIVFSSESKFNPIPEGNGILNALYNHNKNEEKNLYFVFLNFRHGARSPLLLKNNHTDLFGSYWSMPGELTELGRRQHYELGLKNRERYSNFISEQYDPKEVQIYSTSFARTINSAQSQLLGFYSNISLLTFNYSDIKRNNTITSNKSIANLNEIIPPIMLFQNIENRKEKTIKYEKTFRNHFDCLYTKNAVEQNWNEINEIKIFNLLNNTVSKFNAEYYQILTTEYPTLKEIRIETVRGFDFFCDVYVAVYSSKKNKYILDKLLNYGKNLTLIKEICDDYIYKQFMLIRNDGYAANNALISQSGTLRKVINWMEIKAEQNNNLESDYDKPKFVYYSGHDSTIFELQKILKLSFDIEYEATQFASTQVYELRKYGNVFYVEVYYNDRLKLNLTFDEFKKRINKVIMSEKKIFNICYRKPVDLKNALLTFTIIVLIIALILVIFKIIKEKDLNQNKMKVIQIA